MPINKVWHYSYYLSEYPLTLGVNLFSFHPLSVKYGMFYRLDYLLIYICIWITCQFFRSETDSVRTIYNVDAKSTFLWNDFLYFSSHILLIVLSFFHLL